MQKCTTGRLIKRLFRIEDLDNREPVEEVEAANAMFCVEYLEKKYKLTGTNIVVPEADCNITTRFVIRQIDETTKKIARSWAVVRSA